MHVGELTSPHIDQSRTLLIVIVGALSVYRLFELDNHFRSDSLKY